MSTPMSMLKKLFESRTYSSDISPDKKNLIITDAYDNSRACPLNKNEVIELANEVIKLAMELFVIAKGMKE